VEVRDYLGDVGAALGGEPEVPVEILEGGHGEDHGKLRVHDAEAVGAEEANAVATRPLCKVLLQLAALLACFPEPGRDDYQVLGADLPEHLHHVLHDPGGHHQNPHVRGVGEFGHAPVGLPP
jgi:hypothetical protein